MRVAPCPRATPEGPADPRAICVDPQVRLDTGPRAGTDVEVDQLPRTDRAGSNRATGVRLLDIAEPGQDGYYAFVDFVRDNPIALFAGIYAAVVIAVARLRGLRALLGLGFAYVALVSTLWNFAATVTQPLFIVAGGLIATQFGARLTLVLTSALACGASFLLPRQSRV